MLSRCRFKQLGTALVLLVAAPFSVNSSSSSATLEMQAAGALGYSNRFQMQIYARINRLEDLLQVVEQSPLDFGSFLPITSGSITITPYGAATFSGEFSGHAAFHEGDHTPGEMKISGLANQAATLRFESFTLLQGAGKNMLVTDFQFIDHQGNNLASGDHFQFDPYGQFTLRYGATLTFAEGQESGEYQGIAHIVMNY